MAQEPVLTIGVEVDPSTVKNGVNKIANDIGKAGSKSGNDFGSSFNKSASSALNGLKGSFVAITASVTAAIAGFKSISFAIGEAAGKEEAYNKLNSALIQTGRYTPAASASLQDFANEIQKTTKFSDDAAVAGMALLQTLTNLDTQGLKKASKAAIDMAAGLGLDLRTAFLLVGKAAEGEISTFSRYGMKVKEGATNAETFANTLAMIESKMAGRAASELNTYAGSMALLKNAVGDAAASFGNFIVKNPVVISLIRSIAEQFSNLSDKINEFAQNGGIQKVTNSVIDFGVAIVNGFVLPFEYAWEVAEYAFKMIMNGLDALVTNLLSLLGGVGIAILNAMPSSLIPDSWKEKLQEFTNITTEMGQESGKAFVDGFSTEFDKINQNMSDSLVAGLENLRNAASQSLTQNPPAKGVSEGFQKEADYTGNVFSNLGGSIKQSFDDMYKTSSQFSKSIAGTLTNTLANGAGKAFAAFGKAVASGENPLKAFVNSMIATMGDMAIQLGTMFIAQGLAMSLGGLGNGVPLMAAGAALAAIGGAMSALGSSSESSSASSPTTASTYETSSTPIEDPYEVEAKRSTHVIVNVHGDVLDSDESGMRIVNLINKAVNNNGAVLA